MSDVLIRDVPEDVLVAIDARATRLGISRSEYLRRRLAQDAATPAGTVRMADLRRFSRDFADLAEADVMAAVWE